MQRITGLVFWGSLAIIASGGAFLAMRDSGVGAVPDQRDFEGMVQQAIDSGWAGDGEESFVDAVGFVRHAFRPVDAKHAEMDAGLVYGDENRPDVGVTIRFTYVDAVLASRRNGGLYGVGASVRITQNSHWKIVDVRVR